MQSTSYHASKCVYVCCLTRFHSKICTYSKQILLHIHSERFVVYVMFSEVMKTHKCKRLNKKKIMFYFFLFFFFAQASPYQLTSAGQKEVSLSCEDQTQSFSVNMEPNKSWRLILTGTNNSLSLRKVCGRPHVWEFDQ